MLGKNLKTMVLGLGNPIFGDDGVGLRVIEELQKQVQNPDITIEGAELAGLDMLEKLSGYDRVIIIDAIQTGGRVGEIYQLTPEDLKSTVHTGTPHDVNFTTALEFGQRIGVKLPSKIDIVAIEIAPNVAFSEELTPEIEKVVAEVVKRVIEMLKDTLNKS
jgi:hydrogenase maturation protease